MNLNLHKLLKENLNNDSKITEKDELQTLWAAVIEIMHIASLIHDDILDNSKTRRGLITVHEAYSKKLATFAGNFLIGRA